MALVYVAGTAVVWFAWTAWTAARNKRNVGPLPPGPKGLPVIGNVLDIPPKELWIRANKWKALYGDVCYQHIFGLGIVVLNSYDVASELLDGRGHIYSDRPRLTMAGELCGANNMIGISPYGEQLIRHRRLFTRALGSQSVRTYESLIARETGVLLRHITDRPELWQRQIRRYAGTLTLAAIYGYQAGMDDDKLVGLAEESVNLLANDIIPSGSIWLVDVFPFLKYLPEWTPGASFKRKARVWRTKLEEFVDTPYQYAKNSVANGTAWPSFCASILEEDGKSRTAQQEFDLKWSANSMFGASIDTTVAAMSQLFYALTQHPEILKRAQAEIDNIVGPDRLPISSDRPKLPYIDALFCETLRYAAPVPMGLPHRLTEDDSHNGMFIPKGSFVFANIWAMSRDPIRYSDPDVFRPERFLNLSDEQARDLDPRRYVYGFGRRRCPGVHLVETSLWHLIACIVTTFDITPSLDVNGNPLIPQLVYDNGVFRLPNSFQCQVRPRSAGHEKLISGLEM